MLKLLEPVIEKRTEEILNTICDDEQDELFTKFIAAAAAIKAANMEAYLELENIFILRTKQAVDIAYKSGLLDMHKLK